MKLTMTTVMCGPEGNAFPGTVLEIKDKETIPVTDEHGTVTQELRGEYMIKNKYARPYNPETDRKARHGLIKAEK